MIILIIGNSGCGKTYLSKNIAKIKKIPLFHMDQIKYKPEGYTPEFERTKEQINQIVKNIMKNKSYVIEGASIALGRIFVKEATHLILINYQWEVCKASIFTRNLDCGRPSPIEERNSLLKWAEKYYERTEKNIASFKNHKKLFDDFKKTKYRLDSREEANNLCTKFDDIKIDLSKY
tara:strand:+ start:173 stop:703 length:531 start_codon:yes stop_codon:yes gene_type:complete